MFRNVQIYMGDASATGETVVDGPGAERTLRDILMCGRSNPHLAGELYCQLVKQTHLCMDVANEVGPVILDRKPLRDGPTDWLGSAVQLID